MRAASLLAWAWLLAAAFGGKTAAAPPRAPRALVLEFADKYTKGARGAQGLLARAGFEVLPLKIDGASVPLAADLVFLGTFSSEHPSYRAFMSAHGKDLAAFAERGGVILQMAQADETEAEPPFLPAGRVAWRGDEDLAALRVTATGHPLLEGLADEEGSIVLPKHLNRPANWESLVHAVGFRVLVASDEAARRPALLETEFGKGRVLLSSLFLDKIEDAAGNVTAPEDWRRASERFFANLAAYVASVRDGTAPRVPDAPPPPAGKPPEIRWRLGPSDTARYARRWSATKDGKSDHRPDGSVVLHGHMIRPAGRCLPASAVLDDVPLLFGLSLPPPGAAAGAPVEFSLPLDGVSEILGTAEHRVRLGADGSGEVDVASRFASLARDPRAPGTRVSDGIATVSLRFDPKDGVVRESYGRVAYVLHTGSGREEKKEHVVERFGLVFEGVKRLGDASVRDEVNAAIDKGVKRLRALQKDDGTFEPLKGWDAGSTALALLALTSCEVPLGDPAVEKGIAWLTRQPVEKTYEMALGLMALDRAYTPPEEAARYGSAPEGKAVRNLPPDRRAWCARLAETLDRTAGSPGAWGYPPGPRSLVMADSSNTQYGLLGMRAAVRLGLPVRPAVWAGVVRHFQLVREREAAPGTVTIAREGQSIDLAEEVPVRSAAGFRYSTREERAWGSMTSAGIACLAIARHELRQTKQGLTAKDAAEIDEMLLGGWAWFQREWRTDRNPGKRGDDWTCYYLYSLERAAILDGVKRIAGRDWYFEGAMHLLAQQASDGGWTEPGGNATTATSFALLFLKRATAALPVLTSDR